MSAANREQAEAFLRAAHDIRNPIAVLRATLEWLASEVAAGDVADAVGDATAATQRLALIADNLELLARLDDGRLVKTSVPLAPLVPTTLHVTADPALLSRALDLIVTHAKRGLPSGATLAVEARENGSFVDITIGEGDLESGGLSLYVARRLLEAQGGALVSESGRLLARVPR
jgi:signal transduction histidine kinase